MRVGTACSQSIMLAVYISHFHLHGFPVFMAEVKRCACGSPQGPNPRQRGAHRTVHLHHWRPSGCYPSPLLEGPVHPVLETVRWCLGAVEQPPCRSLRSTPCRTLICLTAIWLSRACFNLSSRLKYFSSCSVSVLWLAKLCNGITIKSQGKNFSWINSGQVVILQGLTQLPQLTGSVLAPSACRQRVTAPVSSTRG